MLKKKTKPRNKFEKRVDRQLKKAKVIYAYESEKIPFVVASHYTPDFVVKLDGFNKLYIECKGYLRAEDKRKLLAIKRQYPSMDLRILFYEYREAQVRWATKRGFQWAVESVPGTWLRGE